MSDVQAVLEYEELSDKMWKNGRRTEVACAYFERRQS